MKLTAQLNGLLNRDIMGRAIAQVSSRGDLLYSLSDF